MYDLFMPSGASSSTLEDNYETLGIADKTTPDTISIYPDTFEDKDAIADIIDEYNASVAEEDEISFTDYMALLLSGITTIINAISYGLIAFVSISLVVSSIMIGIITYISVLERTKEIGILRAIGASKKDISRVFNAETLIVGFTAGMIGIIASLLLCLPINLIIRLLSGVSVINAQLPVVACVVLVLISMGLTFVAGLFPSKVAANKDPVVALRTE
jgi:putative ABC transport system permease protein